MSDLMNCLKCGKFGLFPVANTGEIRIKPGESKMFSSKSFTLEQDGEDLVAIPEPIPPMSKLDELDLEFDEKFVEGMNYIANANKLGTKEAIKLFARKYYEAGKLEEREAIDKKAEEIWNDCARNNRDYVSKEEVFFMFDKIKKWGAKQEREALKKAVEKVGNDITKSKHQALQDLLTELNKDV